jgi:hypothetical protein
MAIHVTVRRVGGNAEFETPGLCSIQVIEHAGQDGLAGAHIPVQEVVFLFECGTVGVGTEGAPWIEFNPDVADESERPGAWVGIAGTLMNGRQGVDERGFRIDHESVKIEYQRANHEPYKPDKGTPSQAAARRTLVLRAPEENGWRHFPVRQLELAQPQER